MNYLKS